MRNNQVGFNITKEKEKEFFEYVINECDCQIYRLYKCDEKVTYQSDDEITDFTYFIKSDFTHKDVRYQKDENGMCLYPFDSEMNFYPFVLYERLLAENDCAQTFCRLYLPKNVKKEYASGLKTTYKQIADWIKKNSCKKERDGLFKIYLVE